MNELRGRAFLFGDHVNTDVIHPPQFFSLDPARVKMGLFHGYDPTLHVRLRAGDLLVGGRNFGCGSSRETSIRSIKLNRIGAIVAVDFARIFLRSATNNGIPCLTFRDPRAPVTIGQEEGVRLSFEDWTLTTDTGVVLELEPVSDFIRRIWEAGGLLETLAVPSPNESSPS